MIFKCNLCGGIMHELTTPGDEINSNFFCQKCSKGIKETLKKAKKKILDTFQHFPKLT